MNEVLSINELKDILDGALEDDGVEHLDVIGLRLDKYLEREGLQHAELVELFEGV